MILSNNPKTYIIITIYNNIYGIKIRKKYINRWAGPSAAHPYNLHFAPGGNAINKLRRIYDPK